MARAPRITEAYLKKLIMSGAGTGHGEEYRPFLEIRRWNPSPVSTQVVGGSTIPPFRRRGHFFSYSEWRLALLYAWAGCWVREQLPMWSWTHPHPLIGYSSAAQALPWSKGLWGLCRDSNINHGYFPGTRIPYVWTIDLALTLPWIEDPAQACAFVSVKPLLSEAYLHIDPLARGAEKLEVERRYCAIMGIHYFVGDRALYPGQLLDNLDWLHKAAVLPVTHKSRCVLDSFLDRHAANMSQEPPLEWRLLLEQDFSLSRHAADYLIQHCLWNQLVDADLNGSIDLAEPITPGGQSFRRAVQNSLLREVL